MMVKNHRIAFFLLLFVAFVGFSQNNNQRVVRPSVHSGLKFTENLGQWTDSVLFKTSLVCGNLFFEKGGLTYFLYDNNKFKDYHLGGSGKYTDRSIKAHAFRVNFLNCNKDFDIKKKNVSPAYENFYIGSDSKRWKSNVRSYKQIEYKSLYNAIDYEAIASDAGIKYNFYVRKGGNYKDIKLEYEGVDRIRVRDGELVITTDFCEVIENKPYAFQLIDGKEIPIPCKYILKNKTLSFEILTGYDINYDLVIDPTLVFAAQSGSTADNFGMTATFDAQGNLYTGGTVFDLGYPYINGSYSNIFNGPVVYGNTDIVVSKYNSSGTAMIYSTYYGGNRSEVVTSLIVDQNNNLCLYGATGSGNLPITANAYDAVFNGGTYLEFYFNGTVFINGTDIYVAKFNSAGSALLGSTYIGGSANDGVNHTNTTPTYTLNVYHTQTSNNVCLASTNNYTLTEPKADSLQFNYGDQYRGEIQLDKFGNIYISSSTRSADFPTMNSFDNTLGGKQDAVVFKFDQNLTSLVWSSYLGGAENDAGYGLIVTDSLHTYVTGGTYSPDFPVKVGCHSTTYNGGKADGYIVKIDPSGSSILKGTYIGTSSYDQSYCIQKDKNYNIYVFGQSQGNMPIVGTPYSNPGSHQFISRYNNQLTNRNLSTVVGSGQSTIDISPSAFSVDNCGNIYISGWGGNIIYGPALSGMPTTSNAAYPSTPNGYDFYLMALSQNAASLVYATYFGGSCSMEHVDGGTSRFDPTGKVYQSVCAGCQNSDDFPVPLTKWPCNGWTTCPSPGPNLSANCNNGVFKYDFDLNIAVSSITTNTISGCAPLTVNFTSVYTPTNAAATFTWYYGNGQTNTTVVNPAYTYTTPGTYTISLVINDPSTCNVKDSSIAYITVLPIPITNFSVNISPCGSTVVTTNSSTGTLTANPFVWDWGDATPTISATAPSHTYATSGIYTITLVATGTNGCSSSATRTVSIFYFNPAVTPGLICEGGSTNLTASGGTSYTWNPPTGISNTTSPNVAANPTATTIYTVTIVNTGANPPCIADATTQVIVNPKPTAGFTYSMNPCGGGVNFYDASTASITAWNWAIQPLPTIVTSTLQDPYHFYQNGGTFTVSLIATNQYGCKDTTQQVLVVPVPPPLSVNSLSNICKGNQAQLVATGGTAYAWSPGITLSGTNIANPVATPTINTNYSVVITTSNGCSFLLLTGVSVFYLSNTPISVSATPTQVVQGDGSVLQYFGDQGANISWNPSTFVTPKTGYSVTAFPDRPTTYTVIASNGPCKETLYVFVDVVLRGCEEGDAFVPNTFTPNGDGQNDVLYARGLKMEEIYFAVYNRWGEMVFETKDKTKGWDGIYKGKPADVGVFGWYLKVKCFDGTERFKKGNVTLIR